MFENKEATQKQNNITNVSGLFDSMSSIEYGWLDKNNNKHFKVNSEFSESYILQTPQQVLNNKIGVCWDQVELERYYFDIFQIPCKTYFLVYNDNNRCPTHTFLVFEQHEKYYWFEHAWGKFKGIHSFNTLSSLLINIKNIFVKEKLLNNYDVNNLCLFEYSKPKYNIDCLDFYKHCEKNKNISKLIK